MLGLHRPSCRSLYSPTRRHDFPSQRRTALVSAHSDCLTYLLHFYKYSHVCRHLSIPCKDCRPGHWRYLYDPASDVRSTVLFVQSSQSQQLTIITVSRTSAAHSPASLFSNLSTTSPSQLANQPTPLLQKKISKAPSLQNPSSAWQKQRSTVVWMVAVHAISRETDTILPM